MAGYSSEEKWKQLPQESFPSYTQQEGNEEEEEEEEEEEALSLCDLPVSLIGKDDTQTPSREEQKQSLLNESTNQEEFEFRRWGGDSLSVRSEMCAAEDIFYKGQILPLRHSFILPSSKRLIHDRMRYNVLSPVANCSKDEFWVSTISLNFKKSMSRSESMDRALLSGFNSSRSSSSSSRSTQYSSNTSITTTTNSDFVNKRIVNDKNSKPRIPNQFRGNQPSPGPQIRHSNVSHGSVILGSGFIRNRKSSSIWDFFKLGLVRTPGNGIHELQDLKVRSTVSRNSSSGSSNNSIGNSNSNTTDRSKKNNNFSTSEKGNKVKKQGLFEKRGGGSLISGCSCTINAVKPIPLNYVAIKSNNSSKKNVEAKKKRRKKKKNKSLEKLTKQNEVGKVEEEDGLGKQETSRHRTFEWVKELSQASYLDQQEKEEAASWDS